MTIAQMLGKEKLQFTVEQFLYYMNGIVSLKFELTMP